MRLFGKKKDDAKRIDPKGSTNSNSNVKKLSTTEEESGHLSFQQVPKKNEDDDGKNDPFTLIKNANELASKSQYWSSCDLYLKASKELHKRYCERSKVSTEIKESASSTTVASNKSSTKKSNNITRLYHIKSIEFFHKARKSFINALELEQKQDTKNIKVNNKSNSNTIRNDGPKIHMMNNNSNTDENLRQYLFRQLFVSSSSLYESQNLSEISKSSALSSSRFTEHSEKISHDNTTISSLNKRLSLLDNHMDAILLSSKNIIHDSSKGNEALQSQKESNPSLHDVDMETEPFDEMEFWNNMEEMSMMNLNQNINNDFDDPYYHNQNLIRLVSKAQQLLLGATISLEDECFIAADDDNELRNSLEEVNIREGNKQHQRTGLDKLLEAEACIKELIEEWR